MEFPTKNQKKDYLMTLWGSLFLYTGVCLLVPTKLKSKCLTHKNHVMFDNVLSSLLNI